MITQAEFDTLRALPWKQRYAALCAVAKGVQASMAEGELIDQTKFARLLFPGLMDRSPAEITAFHHWLRVIAEHNGAAAGCIKQIATRGFAKGKETKRWLWGNSTKLSLQEFM